MAAATMNTDVEAVDFDSDDDDLMDEEGAIEPSPAPAPRLRSTIAGGGGGGGDDGPLKTKGRGFREDPNSSSAPRDSRLVGVSRASFDALASDGGPGPVRSIEGWIVLVTGIHEEAQEDDLHNIFGNFGQVKNLHLNLDRRTGFVKGYALIEYENFEEAQAAIKASDGTELLTQIISVDWAFSNGPVKRRNTRKREVCYGRTAGAAMALVELAAAGSARTVKVLGLIAKNREGRQELSKIPGIMSVLCHPSMPALVVLNWICYESNELAMEAIKLGAFQLCEALVNDDNYKIARNAVELARTLEKV